MTNAPIISRTFRSGNSEAVRLPKDVAYGCDVELAIVRSGEVLTIYPVKPPVAQLVRTLAAMPKPGAVEIRDEDYPPERSGL